MISYSHRFELTFFSKLCNQLRYFFSLPNSIEYRNVSIFHFIINTEAKKQISFHDSISNFSFSIFPFCSFHLFSLLPLPLTILFPVHPNFLLPSFSRSSSFPLDFSSSIRCTIITFGRLEFSYKNTNLSHHFKI